MKIDWRTIVLSKSLKQPAVDKCAKGKDCLILGRAPQMVTWYDVGASFSYFVYFWEWCVTPLTTHEKKFDDFMYANFRDIFVRINKRAECIFDVWKAPKKKTNLISSYGLKHIYSMLAGNELYFTVKFVWICFNFSLVIIYRGALPVLKV